MELAVKLCLLALAACAAVLIIRGKNPQGAMVLSVAVCGVLFAQIIPALSRIYSYCVALAGYTGMSQELFAPLLKVVGMAVCVRITAELCRDSGERAVAAQVEMAGAALGLVCAFPLVERALGLLGAL